MLFEDQIEQIKEGLQVLQARVQESSTFNKGIERYNSFSPVFQKIILAVVAILILFIALAAPIASYKTSVQNMEDFKVQKNLTQKVIDFSKKSADLAPQPKKYFSSSLGQEVNTLAGSYSIKLLPEQVSVDSDRISKKIVPGASQNGFRVLAKKANIDQATALAYSIKKLNKSLLITGLDFQESREMPGYFDSTIKVANLSVEPIASILPKPEVTKTTGRKRKGRGR
jgi:hypothetical protein